MDHADMRKPITVAELRELLRSVPDDLPIYLGDWNEEWAPDHPMGFEDVPILMPPRNITQQGLVVGFLPRRVVIGRGSHREDGEDD